jgi:hypothetical protein
MFVCCVSVVCICLYTFSYLLVLFIFDILHFFLDSVLSFKVSNLQMLQFVWSSFIRGFVLLLWFCFLPFNFIFLLWESVFWFFGLDFFYLKGFFFYYFTNCLHSFDLVNLVYDLFIFIFFGWFFIFSYFFFCIKFCYLKSFYFFYYFIWIFLIKGLFLYASGLFSTGLLPFVLFLCIFFTIVFSLFFFFLELRYLKNAFFLVLEDCLNFVNLVSQMTKGHSRKAIIIPDRVLDNFLWWYVKMRESHFYENIYSLSGENFQELVRYLVTLFMAGFYH